MKTADMIHILRCAASDKHECKYCHCQEECNQFLLKFNTEPSDWFNEMANRMEQLLINLRTTQEQLQTVKGEKDAWHKRYIKLQNGLKNIVHENDLLDNLMN